jgi:hypothetical protein
MVTRLINENQVFETGEKKPLFSSSHREWIMGPPCIVRNSKKLRFPNNKKTEHKAGHLDPSCSEIKNVWLFTSTERINGMFITEV